MSESQVIVGGGEIRIHLQGLPQLFDPQIVLSRIQENPSMVRVDDKRKRVERLGPLDLGQGFFVPAQFGQESAIPLVGGRIAWVQLDRAPELSLGTRPVPV